MRLWAIFFCAFLPVANFGMARRPAGGDALIPVPLEPRFMETSIPGDLKLVRTNTDPENTLSVPDLRRIPLSLAAFEEDHVNEDFAHSKKKRDILKAFVRHLVETHREQPVYILDAFAGPGAHQSSVGEIPGSPQVILEALLEVERRLGTPLNHMYVLFNDANWCKRLYLVKHLQATFPTVFIDQVRQAERHELDNAEVVVTATKFGTDDLLNDGEWGFLQRASPGGHRPIRFAFIDPYGWHPMDYSAGRRTTSKRRPLLLTSAFIRTLGKTLTLQGISVQRAMRCFKLLTSTSRRLKGTAIAGFPGRNRGYSTVPRTNYWTSTLRSSRST